MAHRFLLLALVCTSCGNESSNLLVIDSGVDLDGSSLDASPNLPDASPKLPDAQEATACAESAIFFVSRVGGFKDIFKVRPDGAELTNLTNSKTIHEVGFQVSTDGSLIAFQRNVIGDDLFVMSSESGTAEVIGDFDVENWAPDHSFILVRKTDSTEEPTDLWRINPDGTGATRLTETPALHEALASVSADSNRIIFTRSNLSGTDPKVVVMTIDGTNDTEVAEGISARWHPIDDDKFLYRSFAEPADIFVGGGDLVVPVNLTNSPLDSEWGAEWSPDGTMIAYHIGNEIFVSDSDGSNKKKVFPLADQPNAVGGRVSWSPDSKQLAMSVADGDTRLTVLDLENMTSTPVAFLTDTTFVQWRCVDSSAQL